ncbi:MAG TPA: methyltransferase domain-containing protein [Chthoniobacterales bacterium]
MNSVPQPPTQFDFGENWEDFSRNALDSEKVRQAKEDFQRLLDGIPLENRSFLDIGFGQGLSLLSAASGGARCLGIDINARCLQVLSQNGKSFFPDIPDEQIGRLQGSILDPELIHKLQLDSRAKEGKFDIVHSWGVLHHTGSMFQAIQNSAALVSDQGYLVLAIYQTHWSSPLWKWVKFLYNKSPAIGRRLFIWLFYPLIYLAKWIVTRENPKNKNRGMDFYHDVIDWVGGYPYEYANRAEITDYLKELGFDLIRFFPPAAPTGCMEFVFRKRRVALIVCH